MCTNELCQDRGSPTAVEKIEAKGKNVASGRETTNIPPTTGDLLGALRAH